VLFLELNLAVKALKPWTIYLGSLAKPIKIRVPLEKMLKEMKNLKNTMSK
jgi:hypothetical protein